MARVSKGSLPAFSRAELAVECPRLAILENQWGFDFQSPLGSGEPLELPESMQITCVFRDN